MIEGLDIADARVWRREETKVRSIEAGALADAMRDEENLVWVDLLDPSRSNCVSSSCGWA